MATAKFCDQCGQPYPEFQVGSAEISYTAWYGSGVADKRTMDVCKNCNPFLQLKVKELEQRKRTLEEQAEKQQIEDTTPDYPGLHNRYYG